ncbi:MAG TPA: metallophosphoesterase family protein [Polaromonas sp.]|uniref:metallophosphoesterase family protein n=1 Tax=Polaromonas sp. TaxID=1869339 RepID=UPI002D43210C|nr:metallophosphoesterase family protein [Polaromonas sp.]HYW58163.1 metallophosphoesterase family protein [Polaromonas sp.]
MKLALLSDIHANLHALEACLSDAAGRGATQYAFLGDLVGYGAQPSAVMDCVMALAAQGAWVIRGNHDEASARPTADTTRADTAGAAWTHAQLSPAQLSFLGNLPLTRRESSTLLVHASAHEPQRWHYVESPREAEMSLEAAGRGVTHVFGGHVHHQRLFYRGAGQGLMAFDPTPGVAVPVPAHRQWLATVGSVGQPRDGHCEAMYTLFDVSELQLTFLRVPYDHLAAAQAIRSAGLPVSNADRLAIGR